MSGLEITDPDILAQIKAQSPGASSSAAQESSGGTEITDPDILQQINGGASAPSAVYADPDSTLLEPIDVETASTPQTKPTAYNATGPVYGAELTPEDRELAQKLASRKDISTALGQGVTLGFLDEIKAGLHSVPSYVTRKMLGKETSIPYEYRRILNIEREANRIYETDNPVGSWTGEIVGAFANPIGGAAMGPATALGKTVGAGILSKVSPAWGGVFASRLADTMTRAGVVGAAYGAPTALGKAENLSPSQYATTPVGGAIEGAAYGAALTPAVGGVAAGLAYGAKKFAPAVTSLGATMAQALPEAPKQWFAGKADAVARKEALENTQRALGEIGDTVNKKNVERGRREIDPIENIRQEILPPIVPSRGRGITDYDHAEKIVNNVDAVEKAVPSVDSRGKPNLTKRNQVLNTMVGKNLTPDQRIAEINSKSYLTPQQKETLTNAIRENPVEASERLPHAKATDYYKAFENRQQVPTNIIEHSAGMARAAERKGAEEPMVELGRVAAGAGGAEKSALAAELIQRQSEQPFRMANHIREAVADKAGDFQNLGQAKDAAANLTGSVARKAYTEATDNPVAIDLTEKLAEFTRKRMGMTGDAGTALGKAIQDFRDVHHKGAPYGLTPEEQGSLTAVFKGHTYQSDTSRFQDARDKLDDAIKVAKGHAYQVLNEFRTEMNNIARKQNPILHKADSMFSEGKSIDKIIDTAHNASTKLNHTAESTIKYFDELQPEQKDLFRMAFAEKLTEIIESAPENSAFVGGKFMNKRTRDMIKHIFGSIPGEILNTKIVKEAGTTATLYKSFGGSKTTHLSEILKQFRMGAELPVEAAFGAYSPHKALGAAKDLLKYNVMNRQAKHLGDILSTTDPIKNLKTVRALKEAREVAQGSSEARSALAHHAAQVWSPLLANTRERDQ